MGRIGDDAHFGAAEVVIEEVLKPHAGNEEQPQGDAAQDRRTFHMIGNLPDLGSCEPDVRADKA